MTKQKKTFWAEQSNDLVCCWEGDAACISTFRREDEFPMSAGRVACLMNSAYQIGRNAKAKELLQQLQQE